ncbi:MAG: transposase [Methylococcales bacterium]
MGADWSRFKNAQHFTSWLGLCPGTKIFGGKIISAATTQNSNRAAQARKMAAVNLRSSQSAPEACYRRLCARRQIKPKPSLPAPTNWRG